MFMIPSYRTSTCVEAIAVDPVRGLANIRFKSSGDEYKYSNVSRRKILNLLFNKNMSLGFWVQQLREKAILELNDEVSSQGKLAYKIVASACLSNEALTLA